MRYRTRQILDLKTVHTRDLVYEQGTGRDLYLFGLGPTRNGITPCVLPVPFTAGKSSQSWITITPLPGDVRSQAAVILAGMLLTHPQETTL